MGIFKVDPERVNKEKKYALGEEKTLIFPPAYLILIMSQIILLPGNFCESCLYSWTQYNGRQSEREMGVLND